MPPTDQLKEEHREILLMLKVLENVCARIQEKVNIDLNHLEGILEFFKIFVDECHHGKEEELLFPALVPLERRLINELLGEHSEGRGYVRAMSRGFFWIKKNQEEALAEYAANAWKCITLLTCHIQKEDNVFFPLADMILGKKKQEELRKGFVDLERKRIGEETRGELRRFLAHMEEFYLQ